MSEKTTQRRRTRSATIGGRRFELDRGRVEQAVAQLLPEPIQEHFVVVGGRRFPPKQVVSAVTGLDRADFTTHQSRRILLGLGFPAARRARPGGSDLGAAPGNAGAIDAAARGEDPVEELRRYIGQWVALRRNEVLVGAPSASEVISWLARYNQQADAIFRVPEDDAAVGGVGPW